MEQNRNESHSGNFRYEWDQSYDDLTVYIDISPETTKSDISVEFKPNFINIKISENKGDRELKGALYGTIDASESFWLLQERELEVHLSKATSGEVWEYLIRGDRPLSMVAREEEKKRLLLERFQREHPTFDFSDAQVNGTVPEPRTFMK